MRRAMPYPWSGPSVSRVLSTMNASVPCQRSVLDMWLLWEADILARRRPGLRAKAQGHDQGAGPGEHRIDLALSSAVASCVGTYEHWSPAWHPGGSVRC